MLKSGWVNTYFSIRKKLLPIAFIFLNNRQSHNLPPKITADSHEKLAICFSILHNIYKELNTHFLSYFMIPKSYIIKPCEQSHKF
jgi:hypothetical protein